MNKFISDYMENGFLDNIIDLFKQDKSLFPVIGDMLKDERSRVRLGAVALVETLMKDDFHTVVKAIPSIADALKNENPTIRGDAAYLLGIIGHRDALPFLLKSDDENELVREAVAEAVEAIQSGDKSLLS
ncbi:MAG: HEAT repeat domain-containing protein [Nitrospiraceae bacterium]|nr:MAG: HEAT repeat domain-containing protein [Nitrospiraceae bacterium]